MTTVHAPSARTQIDPRAPRFGAALTSILLSLSLVLHTSAPTASVVLLGVQTLAFAAGALIGLHAQPWGLAFRMLVRPLVGPPAELEDAAAPRFAQGLGLVFAIVALLGVALGSTAVFLVAAGLALVAALLNAVFDFCLGCEIHLIGRRLLNRPTGSEA